MGRPLSERDTVTFDFPHAREGCDGGVHLVHSGEAPADQEETFQRVYHCPDCDRVAVEAFTSDGVVETYQRGDRSDTAAGGGGDR